jgi:hypothetical protein
LTLTTNSSITPVESIVSTLAFTLLDVIPTAEPMLRSFLTKEERIALLKEYKDELEKEGQGVVEKIKELETS